ncbi:MAG: OB-fold nucleic acid binding domain-containing protein [bacterium]|nr:MAG: OB-fold nucleic acid binding domain-containing protein [bacterium]
MFQPARNAVRRPLANWPGWSTGCCLVALGTSGFLSLAAIHPGHTSSPMARLGTLAGTRRFSLDDLTGLQRPGVAIGPIIPHGITLITGEPVETPTVDDSLYVFWPPRPERPQGIRSAGRATPTRKFPVDDGEELVVRNDEDSYQEPGDTIDDKPTDAAERVNLPPLVHLVSPNGREHLVCDSTLVIGWHAEDDSDVAMIKLEFSADGGRHWVLLADSLGNSGEWEWTVPWVETGRGRLRVTAHDDSGLAGVDVGDRNFTIARPAWMTRGRSLLTLSLDGPMPNPVREACRFLVGMPEAGFVELVLFAVSGSMMRRLWSGPMNTGSHPIDWDGRDEAGLPAASGVYFARLVALGSRMVRRLVMVR